MGINIPAKEELRVHSDGEMHQLRICGWRVKVIKDDVQDCDRVVCEGAHAVMTNLRCTAGKKRRTHKNGSNAAAYVILEASAWQ